MNIGTHFNYNNHITFISTHTKIGIPHEEASIAVKMKVIRLFELSFTKHLSWIRQFRALCIGGRGLATIDRLLTVSFFIIILHEITCQGYIQ